MNSGKRAIFAGLAAGILFAIALFQFARAEDRLFVVPPGGLNVPDLEALNKLVANGLYINGKEVQSLLRAPAGSPVIAAMHTDGTVSPRPLSAVVVSQCNLAVALYIQVDATHLLRADPRQSDVFTAVNGEQRQTQGGPLPWDDAIKLAQAAVLTSRVVLPCVDTST
jgi:hypothetical protein